MRNASLNDNAGEPPSQGEYSTTKTRLKIQRLVGTTY